MGLAPTRVRQMAAALTRRRRPRGRRGQLAVVNSLALCLALLCATIVGLSLGPATASTRSMLAGLAVPTDQLQAIRDAALSCPLLTPPRLAAQVMAASKFDPRASAAHGGFGVAGLTGAQWRQWAPSPRAMRGDARASIVALAHDVCDLSGWVRTAHVPGDLWSTTLAAFHSGLRAVIAAHTIPAGAAGYVHTVAGYANWYTQQRQFGGHGVAAPATPRPKTTTPATPRPKTTTPAAASPTTTTPAAATPTTTTPAAASPKTTTPAAASPKTTTPAAASMGGGQPVPVPSVYASDVIAAGHVCPTVTPARVAALLMVESAFNPNKLGDSGAQGIAQFLPSIWKLYAPSAGASPWDPHAAIRALGVAECDLIKQMSPLRGDSYALALAAFQWGISQVRMAGSQRALTSLGDFIQTVIDFSDYYAHDPQIQSGAPRPPGQPGPTPSPTPSKTPSTTPSPAPSTTPTPGPASRWQLTWSDNFSGPAGSAPNPSKWGHDTGGNGWGNSELEDYTSSTANAALDGRGHLVITARKGGAPGSTCWYGTCSYTSARLLTLGHFSQAYGRISARIKIPQGQGIWPSFWALGANFGTVGWPQSGQMDIMTSLTNPPATVSAGLVAPNYNKWSRFTLSSGTFADGYHIFSADWYPDQISFFVDGQLYGTQTRAQAGASWVFNHPFFLILNLAVGGKEPGNPNASTTFPQQMLVDWVRVFKAAP